MENNALYKGSYVCRDGYVMTLVAPKKYSGQHRVVMEKKLGRALTPDEIVHHRNEVKTDNDPDNLELTDRSSHVRIHAELRRAKVANHEHETL